MERVGTVYIMQTCMHAKWSVLRIHFVNFDDGDDVLDCESEREEGTDRVIVNKKWKKFGWRAVAEALTKNTK